ncbi:chemotaxis protein CheW [Rhodothalassium salexigens]|uniref:chemotaxis protein CheW n=1 Tax=Rhodothalassium salexigens TaxID=1086 RepID=UPI001913CE2B|nr:chemotaxis protein CheW [Rhodothalassium salexigens]
MDDLLNEFLTETAESLEVVDVELVKLEQDPENADVLDNIFRLVHTIKGTCGFLGLPRLETVAHASENVLGKFRDKELTVTREAITVVLQSLDRIKEILAELEASAQEPAGSDDDLVAKLNSIADGKAPEAAAPSAAAAPAKDAKPAPQAGASKDDEAADPTLGRELRPGEVSLDELERAFLEAEGPEDVPAPSTALTETRPGDASEGAVSLFDRAGGADSVSVAAHLLAQRIGRYSALAEFFEDVPEDVRKAKFTGLLTALLKEDEKAAENVGKGLVTRPGFEDRNFDALSTLVKDVLEEIQLDTDTRDDAVMALELVRDPIKAGSDKYAKAPTGQAAQAEQAKQTTGDKKGHNQSIRVSLDLLEDLMNMVSELVLTRNQLLQLVRNQEDSDFGIPIQRLSQTTSELQEGVMKTRMQPIGNAWSKLPRIVRDLSVDLDKKIDLQMKGAETELDRQVLELIKDPLTHMVRNSADHGIETPAERVAAGKSETGTVHLNAFHEGGHIIIEISDDGGGISVEKVRKKILEKGLASEAELEDMTDGQIQKFVFHAGFSTAAQVTNVSGRGVGMDVVRTNIEKIGGTIDMTSVEGKGSTFQIKIPLTLAIVAAMIVESAGERFAIPQISVLELVRANEGSEHRIERIKDSPVLRLRNRLLPLVYLNEVLGFTTPAEIEARENPDDFVVITQVGAFTFGLVVDQVFDTEEIVVKPVAPILKDLDIYSGNTILGDGSVIMILDPNGVANHASAHLGDTGEVQAQQEESAVLDAADQVSDKESLLVFRAGSAGQKAVPLSLVARLEDIERAEIEESDGQFMVQYRGALMPVVLVEGLSKLVDDGRQPVLVFTDGDYTMGLAVDEILDIVEEDLDIKLASDHAGMVGSAIINGHATELIDVGYYLGKAFSDWLRSRDTMEDAPPAKQTRLLLIDDSAFFRNMLKPLLQVAGYRVKAVDRASQALELRENGERFDLIVSDIDMPEMDGFEFAQIVKSGGLWAHVPLIALSSYASPKHLERGRKVGFDDYIAKFDRDALLHSLSQQLKLHGDAA